MISEVFEFDTAVSEAFFGLLFREFLKRKDRNTLKGRRLFLYEEVAGLQGIADLIAIASQQWSYREEFLARLPEDFPRKMTSDILARLERRRSVSLSDLASRIGSSEKYIKEVAHRAQEVGLVRVSASGDVSLGRRKVDVEGDIIFFELKMTKWRRALAQAIQAKIYADKAYCVFPIERRESIDPHREEFARSGVGLIYFDVGHRRAVEAVRVRLQRPAKKSGRLHLLMEAARPVSL